MKEVVPTPEAPAALAALALAATATPAAPAAAAATALTAVATPAAPAAAACCCRCSLGIRCSGCC